MSLGVSSQSLSRVSLCPRDCAPGSKFARAKLRSECHGSTVQNLVLLAAHIFALGFPEGRDEFEEIMVGEVPRQHGSAVTPLLFL